MSIVLRRNNLLSCFGVLSAFSAPAISLLDVRGQHRFRVCNRRPIHLSEADIKT